MKNVHVERIIPILRREVARFREPSVSTIAREENPFQVLVSCILSLRTRDAVTSAASERLFRLANTPEKMLALPEKAIRKAIYPVSFYRVKARNIQGACRILLEKHGGKVPQTMEQLLELPGVGRKTANIVLVYGFRKEGLPIDTHCHRIPNRLGWIRTRTPEETEQVLRKQLPKKYWQDFNDIFVTFGQNVCLPVRPRCSSCAIARFCRRVGVERSR